MLIVQFISIGWSIYTSLFDWRVFDYCKSSGINLNKYRSFVAKTKSDRRFLTVIAWGFLMFIYSFHNSALTLLLATIAMICWYDLLYDMIYFHKMYGNPFIMKPNRFLGLSLYQGKIKAMIYLIILAVINYSFYQIIF